MLKIITAVLAITIEPYFFLANLIPLGLKRNNEKTTLTEMDIF